MNNNQQTPNLVLETEDGTTGFVVRPVPCTQTASEDINIRMNKELIDTWIFPCEQHDEKVLICSAGPSLEKYIPKIKQYQEKGWKVSCVKHSLPRLMKHGVTPDYCVVLDPRSVTGTSTHGKKRSSLYEEASDSTIFFVASVTDYRTTELLVEKNKRIIGWHRFVSALKGRPEIQPQLGGGSCSGLGSIALFQTLGFREAILVGFDSSYDETTYSGSLKTFKFGSKYEPHKRFLSTGELGAQAQEIEGILLEHRGVFLIRDIWSGGLVGNIWRHFQKNYHLPNKNLLGL
jgi:hypothetical protein